MRPTRRAFLRSAALAAAPFVVRASALGKDGRPAASERITLGMIGLGSMGLRHVKGFVQEADCQITHACDVDYARRRTALGVINKAYQTADCAEVHDFRDVIENPHIDAFVISLPDHWHAVPCLMACRAGKDVYGEKPLALTIADGQAMVRAVRQAGIVWQMGSWQRSTRHFRFACELVRNGRLGKIQRVDVGLAEGFRPQGRKMCHLLEAQKAQPVPKGFDYNMWLGPAPWAPYTPLRCHWNFRWILDYSGGQVTDDGAHQLDIAHWGMAASSGSASGDGSRSAAAATSAPSPPACSKSGSAPTRSISPAPTRDTARATAATSSTASRPARSPSPPSRWAIAASPWPIWATSPCASDAASAGTRSARPSSATPPPPAPSPAPTASRGICERVRGGKLLPSSSPQTRFLPLVQVHRAG